MSATEGEGLRDCQVQLGVPGPVPRPLEQQGQRHGTVTGLGAITAAIGGHSSYTINSYQYGLLPMHPKFSSYDLEKNFRYNEGAAVYF